MAANSDSISTLTWRLCDGAARCGGGRAALWNKATACACASATPAGDADAAPPSDGRAGDGAAAPARNVEVDGNGAAVVAAAVADDVGSKAASPPSDAGSGNEANVVFCGDGVERANSDAIKSAVDVPPPPLPPPPPPSNDALARDACAGAEKAILVGVWRKVMTCQTNRTWGHAL